ncbi:MAG TPA: ChaB family protein [Gammaproteobacteria bacterium]|nr:ChaB family protein [Gammaproteobacteria bacterium]
MPGREAMPSTIRRSPAKAQRTWIKVHDAAAKEYGDGERAHRTAYAALKHSFERRGDRWVPKDAKGPSDPRAKQTRSAARKGRGKTFGGVDYYGHSKRELYARAKKLGVPGRSTMSKDELASAIARRQKSRSRSAQRH